MKQPQKIPLLLFSGLIIGMVALLALQQPSQFATSVALAIPAEVTPIEGGEILPEDVLLTRALGVARSSGLRENLSIEDLDASQGVITTYRQWIAFQGGNPNPRPGGIGGENFDRPVFIMPILGSGMRPLAGHPAPPDIEATPVVYYAIIVTIYADTGMFLQAGYPPVGIPIPDLSPLRDPLYGTPTPSDIIPLPTVPEGEMRGSS